MLLKEQMLQKNNKCFRKTNVSTRCETQTAGKGWRGGLSTLSTRQRCAMQTQEEELQSRLYFFKLGELKETAQDMVGLSVEAGLSADQLCFVFFPR